MKEFSVHAPATVGEAYMAYCGLRHTRLSDFFEQCIHGLPGFRRGQRPVESARLCSIYNDSRHGKDMPLLDAFGWTVCEDDAVCADAFMGVFLPWDDAGMVGDGWWLSAAAGYTPGQAGALESSGGGPSVEVLSMLALLRGVEFPAVKTQQDIDRAWVSASTV